MSKPVAAAPLPDAPSKTRPRVWGRQHPASVAALVQLMDLQVCTALKAASTK